MQFPIHFGLQKINLPLILIDINADSICMLLDTGANNNYIDRRVCEHFKDHFEKVEFEGSSYGIDGTTAANERMRLTFQFENESYTADFDILPENHGFANIEKEEGVQINGILGSLFFVEHKWVIDFSELMIYSK